MSEPVTPLGAARYDGFATIQALGPTGMLTLRAKPDVAGLDAALAAIGLVRPAPRRIEIAGDRACGWMSPDEYLIVLPHDQATAAQAVLEQALAGQHHLVANVSDARALFRIEGDKADQVLAKLMPVDFARLAEGELRRSRAAQVAVAVWRQDGGTVLVCFRSVAAYVMGILSHSAMPGSELA
jgi:sarcosine oxidase, subunit gamma